MGWWGGNSPGSLGRTVPSEPSLEWSYSTNLIYVVEVVLSYENADSTVVVI